MSYQLTSNPTGDTTPLEWTTYPSSPTTHYSKIDEGMPFKSSSDYNSSLIWGQRDEFGFPSDAPASLQLVTEIWIDLYMQGMSFGEEPAIRIRLYLGDTLVAGTSWNANTSGAWQVRRHKFTGLSLTKAEYNSLDIRVEHIDGTPSYPDPELI